MHIEKLKNIQETLATVAEEQLEHLECVDAKELGEVIDIIKDIEETIYYCTVTKAMKKETEHEEEYIPAAHKTQSMEMIYHSEMMPEHEKSGKSYAARKTYLEAKESHQDKSIQMKELEKYAQELTQDVIDMITDASAEERQYLSKKMVALANKITQLNNA